MKQHRCSAGRPPAPQPGLACLPHVLHDLPHCWPASAAQPQTAASPGPHTPCAELWQQLPFNTEALLAPFSVLMSMLNNRRMCRQGLARVLLLVLLRCNGTSRRQSGRVVQVQPGPCHAALAAQTFPPLLPAGC